VPSGGDADVSLMGDVGELELHESSADAVHADAHRLGLFAMFGYLTAGCGEAPELEIKQPDVHPLSPSPSG